MVCCKNGVKRWGHIMNNGRNPGYVLCRCFLGKQRKKQDEERLKAHNSRWEVKENNASF